MILGMFEEMRQSYTLSMRRAILDYVLRNAKERKRLNLLIAPPPAAAVWGRSDPGDQRE